jgi:uncharacterized protein YdbL (DUF1318 family)
MSRSALASACRLLIALVFASVPLFAQSREELQKRAAERLSTVKVLKEAGKLGETWEGYLAGVKDTDLDEVIEYKSEKIKIRDFMAAENTDRKAVYALIAKEESTAEKPVPVEYVAERSGKDLFRRAEPGHWLLPKGGKWTQKPKPGMASDDLELTRARRG